MPLLVTAHYLAQVQVDHYDRHGNHIGVKWAPKQGEYGRKEPDDYLMAAAYTEFAAILGALDELTDTTIAAHTAAEAITRRNTNRDKKRGERHRERELDRQRDRKRRR